MLHCRELITAAPAPAIPALYLGFPTDRQHPSCHFHLAFKAITYQLHSQKGRSEHTEGHLPTPLRCSARRSSNTSAKASSSLFSAMDLQEKLYGSHPDETQIIWAKSKSTRTHRINHKCHHLSPASLPPLPSYETAHTALAVGRDRRKAAADGPRQNKLVVHM